MAIEKSDSIVASMRPEDTEKTRRDFLGNALAAVSTLAFAGAVEELAPEAAAQTACPPTGLTELPPINALTSSGGKLTGIIKVKNQNRAIGAGGSPQPTRYFAGYQANGTEVWPPGGDSNTTPVPGPTLDGKLGDTVHLSFFNHVDVAKFQGSLDRSEEGRDNGCDQSSKTDASLAVSVKNWYPATDTFPNCLHGSSTANIHFHGTHTTPSTLGDNVLLQIRPLATMTSKEESIIEGQFQKIFTDWDNGVRAKTWPELNSPWTAEQEKAIKHYDATAPYQGGHGLPPDQRLWPQNQMAIDNKIWPQWYVGSFPYSFEIPKFPGPNPDYPHVQPPIPLRMGQAPGTHWYHAHKHGSTAINMFNGMSGAFIIRGDDYDGKLQSFYKGQLKEKLLFIQQLTAVPNLMSSQGGGIPIFVNGVPNKKLQITMRPGEVQLWRLVNSTAGGGQGKIMLQFTPQTQGAAPIVYKQIAQDGVQFAFENYNSPLNGKNPIRMMPANRVDLLVQAPSTPGCFTYSFGTLPQGQGAVLTVVVTGTPMNPAMALPATAADFPTFPSFLADVDPRTIRIHRTLNYGWGGAEPGNNGGPGRDAATGSAPRYTINGKQFQDQIIDEVMLLDSAEEWTVYNSTVGIAHPFHIHINPFQIIEVFDPTNMTGPEPLDPPYIWWDTFGIPPGSNTYPDGTSRLGPDGKQVFVPGYFKMRSRFDDFVGTYVNHCHILAHEDRGMMELVEVVSNRTMLKHH
ncbi:MAG TPA: multicopper oxidase domain-containing protein [Bryobacteraceae bacterium]|nr:multicopper oxidase domain-containing protein [Bryobacteraceae bacterium]